MAVCEADAVDSDEMRRWIVRRSYSSCGRGKASYVCEEAEKYLALVQPVALSELRLASKASEMEDHYGKNEMSTGGQGRGSHSTY